MYELCVLCGLQCRQVGSSRTDVLHPHDQHSDMKAFIKGPHVIGSNLAIFFVKANILAISNDTHQLHYIPLHHFTI